MESRKRGAPVGQRLPYKYVGGMKYTPEECANLLSERVNQAAYIECIIRRAIAYAAATPTSMEGWTQSSEGWDITEGAKLAPEDVAGVRQGDADGSR